VLEHEELLLELHGLQLLLLQLSVLDVLHVGQAALASEAGEIEISGVVSWTRLLPTLQLEVQDVAVLVQWLDVAEHGTVRRLHALGPMLLLLLLHAVSLMTSGVRLMCIQGATNFRNPRPLLLLVIQGELVFNVWHVLTSRSHEAFVPQQMGCRVVQVRVGALLLDLGRIPVLAQYVLVLICNML